MQYAEPYWDLRCTVVGVRLVSALSPDGMATSCYESSLEVTLCTIYGVPPPPHRRPSAVEGSSRKDSLRVRSPLIRVRNKMTRCYRTSQCTARSYGPTTLVHMTGPGRHRPGDMYLSSVITVTYPHRRSITVHSKAMYLRAKLGKCSTASKRSELQH